MASGMLSSSPGLTMPLLAAIAREGMHRPPTNASVVVRDVGEKIRNGPGFEVVIENRATAHADGWVLMG
jgi:hypothetical protein